MPDLLRRKLRLPPSREVTERFHALATPAGHRPVAVEIPEAGPGLWYVVAVRVELGHDAHIEVDVLQRAPPFTPADRARATS